MSEIRSLRVLCETVFAALLSDDLSKWSLTVSHCLSLTFSLWLLGSLSLWSDSSRLDFRRPCVFGLHKLKSYFLASLGRIFISFDIFAFSDGVFSWPSVDDISSNIWGIRIGCVLILQRLFDCCFEDPFGTVICGFKFVWYSCFRSRVQRCWARWLNHHNVFAPFSGIPWLCFLFG